MKTNTLFAALILAAGLSAGASLKAEEAAKPLPVPPVADSPDQSSADEPTVIDHVVYLAKLPTPDELVKGADAKGTPILRIDQTTDRIVVVYQYAGGRTSTFAYTLLSSSNPPAPVASRNAEYRVVTPTPAPPVTTTTVVYQQPDVVYYEPRVRYYDPAWDFWAPLAVGVGLGWGFGGHGHYHGGWHGHGGWHHR